MEIMKSIIIDDEVNAIKTLEWELSGLDSLVSVVNKFTDVKEAVDFLSYQAHKIDLVFLDIQMPAMNGFEFLERFTGRNFEVIFVTAYDEYALQAIKEAAVDYLLKPVEQDELENSLKKVLAKRNKEQVDTKKITIPLENKLMFIDAEDINYCKSNGNYCEIHTDDQTYLISKTLKFIESLLPASKFFRIHQSYLINLKKVKFFDRSSNYVTLTDSKEFPVSRSKREAFLYQL
jgi:two-component system LytT family response regulator